MKAKLIAFVVGAACGALGMFLASRNSDGSSGTGTEKPNAASIHPDRDQQKIASLEKQIAELEAKASANAPVIAASGEEPPRDRGDSGLKGATLKLFGDGSESQLDLAEMQKHMAKAEKERSAKRVAAELASLTKTLNLSDAQAGEVRALLEKQEAERDNGLSRIFKLATSAAEGGDTEANLSTFVPEAAVGEPDPDAFDFDSELLALLDDEQAASYEEYLEARNENHIEATANRQLAQLQTNVPDLSKQQKDQAFNEFARIAREDIAAGGEPGPGSAFDIGRMMKQREAEKAAMEQILTAEQLEVYESNNLSSITIGAPPGAATGAIISTQSIEIESSEPAEEE